MMISRFSPEWKNKWDWNSNVYCLAFYKDLIGILPPKNQIPPLQAFNFIQTQKDRFFYLGTYNSLPLVTINASEKEMEQFKGETTHFLKLFSLTNPNLYELVNYAKIMNNWDRNSRFCGKCGGSTQVDPNEKAKKCSLCGGIIYPVMTPAIIVAITRNDQLLLAHAVRFPGKFYSVLAGFVEPGENLEECIRREVREEVGIEITNIKYFGSQAWGYSNTLMIGFTAEYAEGTLQLRDGELDDAKWFSVNNFPQIPSHVSIARQLIEHVIKNWNL